MRSKPNPRGSKDLQGSDTLFVTVCYALFIYLLNLFLAFLQPKFDPSMDADLAEQDVEEGEPGLPTSSSTSSYGNGKGSGGGGLMSGVFGANGGQQEDEFRPFIRRLPEFKVCFNALREKHVLGLLAYLQLLFLRSSGWALHRRFSSRFSAQCSRSSTFLW